MGKKLKPGDKDLIVKPWPKEGLTDMLLWEILGKKI